jgi:CHAD domain-containing protein
MLRYAAEFFGSLWPGQSMKRYVAALKDLQQALGTLHDTAVAPALSARLKAADGAMDALGKSLMEDWLAKDQRSSRKDAADLWDRFAKRKRFWKSA